MNKKQKAAVLFSAAAFAAAAASSWLYAHFFLFRRFLSLLRCPFRTLTGYPCATCGLTRGVLSIGSGRFREALTESPLAFLAFAYLILLAAVNISFALRRKQNVFLFPFSDYPRASAIALLLLLLLSWAYNLMTKT